MSVKTIAELTAEIKAINIEKGWRPAEGGPGQNTWGDYIALLHSEVSEALEAFRDHQLADATDKDRWNSAGLSKPEGVGAELADVLIRLLDMADVFGIVISGYERLDDVRGVGLLKGQTFGDSMAWLHFRISQAWPDPLALPMVLRVIVSVARRCEIDLQAETERKIAYNATRSFQHGGRTLAVAAVPDPVEASRYNALWMAMPTDSRGWWTSDEAIAFIDQWERLDLPTLTLGDGQGEHYQFWCTDARRASVMLGVPLAEDGSFEIERGEYSVGIAPALEKETKDA